MKEYSFSWLTPQLAVGHAPMSFEELESIKAQGIDAIVNLCGEFCDLHHLEEESGFETMYLPIPDEGTPDMEQMDKALEWMDEALYLGKKVLVHCRHGMGRTGTFVTAYFLRRGFTMKMAEEKLKTGKARSSSFSQWRLLRKYRKRTGELKIREPSLENRRLVDLGPYFSEYEAVVEAVETDVSTWGKNRGGVLRCGADTDECCSGDFSVSFIEAVHVMHMMNRTFTQEERTHAMEAAVRLAGSKGPGPGSDRCAIELACPLKRGRICSLYEFRPIRCRTYGVPEDAWKRDQTSNLLSRTSRSLFLSFSGQFPRQEPEFIFHEVISGRFVAAFFRLLASSA